MIFFLFLIHTGIQKRSRTGNEFRCKSETLLITGTNFSGMMKSFLLLINIAQHEDLFQVVLKVSSVLAGRSENWTCTLLHPTCTCTTSFFCLFSCQCGCIKLYYQTLTSCLYGFFKNNLLCFKTWIFILLVLISVTSLRWYLNNYIWQIRLDWNWLTPLNKILRGLPQQLQWIQCWPTFRVRRWRGRNCKKFPKWLPPFVLNPH